MVQQPLTDEIWRNWNALTTAQYSREDEEIRQRYADRVNPA